MKRETILKAAYTPRKDIKYCSYVGTLFLCELPVYDYHIILESTKNEHEGPNEDMRRCEFVLVEFHRRISETLDDFSPCIDQGHDIPTA